MSVATDGPKLATRARVEELLRAENLVRERVQAEIE
jgi:hypothetical protein